MTRLVRSCFPPVRVIAAALVLTGSVALLAQITQHEQPPPPAPPPTPLDDGLSPDAPLPSAVTLRATDAPSLYAAIAALPASGGVVHIGPGVYEIDKPLVVRSGDTRIEGCGTATQLHNVSQDGQPALLIRPDALDGNPRARLWRVEVCNLRITGNPAGGPGIQAVGVQELILRNLSVDRQGGHGILLDRCEENPRVIGCNLTYNNGSGLHLLGCHDVVVSSNQFEENLDALTLVDGYNLTFTGNNLDDHLRHGVVVENSYGSVIASNMIEECAGTAVVLDRGCYGTAISGNAIAHHLGGGVDLRGAWGCTVAGNNFVLVHQFAIRVGPDSGRHTITGNHFTNSYIGDGKLKRADGIDAPNAWRRDVCAGILLEDATAIVINGNQFSGLTTRAVEARGTCTQLLVTNNLITDHGRGLPAGTPTFDLGQATNSVAEPNLVAP